MINIGNSSVKLMLGDEEIEEVYLGDHKIYPNKPPAPPFIQEWKTSSNMNFARANMVCASIGGKIFAFGGYVEDTRMTDSVEIFDPKLKEWKIIGKMPFPLSHSSIVVVDTKAYIVGGKKEDGSFSDSLLIFDSNTLAYETKTMPMAIRSTIVGADKENLYISSGIMKSGGKDAHNMTTYIFNISTSAWTTTTNIPVPVVGSAYASFPVNGKTFIFGGKQIPDTDHDHAYSYIPERRLWSKYTSNPFKFNSGAATKLLDDRIYITGGIYKSIPTNVVNCFDPNTNGYFGKPAMNTKRCTHCAVECKGVLYAIGGINEEGTLLKTVETFGL